MSASEEDATETRDASLAWRATVPIHHTSPLRVPTYVKWHWKLKAIKGNAVKMSIAETPTESPGMFARLYAQMSLFVWPSFAE